MAKLKIKTITFNGDYANIEFTDGQKASANKAKEPAFGDMKDGDEVDVEIKPWKDKFFANLPKAAAAAGKFPPRDTSWEKRKASLECAINAAKLTGTEIKTPALMALAETFHTYIVQK